VVARKKSRVLTHKQLVTKMLRKPSVKAAVDELNQTEYVILDQILAARKEAGLTQAQVAARMGTQTPAVARLESALATGKHSPSLSTLKRYARALGKRVEVRFV
jgi:DNA-binding XRE family transcriptional regulator